MATATQASKRSLTNNFLIGHPTDVWIQPKLTLFIWIASLADSRFGWLQLKISNNAGACISTSKFPFCNLFQHEHSVKDGIWNCRGQHKLKEQILSDLWSVLVGVLFRKLYVCADIFFFIRASTQTYGSDWSKNDFRRLYWLLNHSMIAFCVNINHGK